MRIAEQNGHADGGVLRWTGKLLSADDLRRHWKGQRELIVSRQTIVTPLAVDELKDRGVRLVRDAACGSAQDTVSANVQAPGYAQERPDPIVTAAVHSLEREGVISQELEQCAGSPAAWAQSLAEYVVREECRGVAVFCSNPGLVCCVANKVGGLRAASVMTVAQAARALTSIGANLLAVEMPGRTLFEIRQIMMSLSKTPTGCPESVADTLQELDGHAHR